MVTQLTDLMSKGYVIQISEMVTPGTVFPATHPEGKQMLIVHPFDYSYLSNDDIFKAHEINMLRIQQNIDKMADAACEKLDKMVWEMDHKHDPRVVGFLPNVEVTEHEDGTFTFTAVNGDSIFSEDAPILTHEYMKRYE